VMSEQQQAAGGKGFDGLLLILVLGAIARSW
jgi:hypothetical protein